jgi:hypothetical protein
MILFLPTRRGAQGLRECFHAPVIAGRREAVGRLCNAAGQLHCRAHKPFTARGSEVDDLSAHVCGPFQGTVVARRLERRTESSPSPFTLSRWTYDDGHRTLIRHFDVALCLAFPRAEGNRARPLRLVSTSGLSLRSATCVWPPLCNYSALRSTTIQPPFPASQSCATAPKPPTQPYSYIQITTLSA